MRIATGAYTEAMLNQFNVLAGKQFNLQNQVSTGLRVQAAADDPVAMQNTLDYTAQKSAQTQYNANVSTLQSRADSVYNVLQKLVSASSSAGELVVSGSNAILNQTGSDLQTSLNNVASNVNDLINEVVDAANTTDPATGQYLFGGTASGTPPFTTTKDASGNVTAVTYHGNTNTNQAEIGDNQTASADIPGANTGAGGPRGLITDQQSGADFINHLISLRDHLLAGDQAAITSTDKTNLQKDENNITYQVSNNGVLQTQLTAASTFATNRSQTLDKMITNASSADMVQTMVQLNQAQTSYQAALQSGAKLMQLSILNYIQ